MKILELAPPLFYILLSNYLLFSKQKKLKSTYDINIKERLSSIPIIKFNYLLVSFYSAVFIHISSKFPNYLASMIGIDILLRMPVY